MKASDDPARQFSTRYVLDVCPPRKVVRRERRVQTYCYVVTLECGHATSYPVNARSADTYKHPKTKGCFQCLEAEKSARRAGQAAEPPVRSAS